MPTVRLLRHALLVTSLLACGRERGATAWTVSVDTLGEGVVRVVNVPPAQGAVPTWTVEEDLRIGTVDEPGPNSFGQIKGIVVTSEGLIVVLDAQAQEIRVFGPDGSHLRTFGGEGGGPGELRGANGMVRRRDGSIWVNDPRNARLSIFHPQSGFVRSTPIEVGSWGWVWNGVIDTAGMLWESQMTLLDGEYWNIRRGFDAEGRWVDTVRLSRRDDTAPDPPGYYRYERGMSTVPFWPRGAGVLDPRRVLWSKGGDGNDYRVARRTFDGDTTLIFESRRRPVPVSATERDSAIARLRELAGRNLDWSRIPDEKPVVVGLLVSDDGRLWVRVEAGEPGATFDVFERDGTYAGTAQTPYDIPSWWRPIVRGDWMWTLVTDEFDVQYVVRGRLVPTSRGVT